MQFLFMPWVLSWYTVLGFLCTNALAVYSDGPTRIVDGYQVETLGTTFDQRFKSQRLRVSYPPVSVPPMTVNDGMISFSELSTFLPCHDCLILAMEADVVYQNGTQATPASSFWLHHAVFVNRGKLDHSCGPRSWGQRFFAVGNERTSIHMSNPNGRISGYHIGESDEVAVSVDLMNMSMEPQEVIFTVTYEFIEAIPKKFVSIQPVWLDIGGCETSSAPAHPNSSFDFTSPTWSSTLSGKIAFIGAHLHDGGTHLQVFLNDKVICEARPNYTAYSSHLNNQPEKHVSTISTCSNTGKVRANDEFRIEAFYDTSIHKPMLNMDGSLEPVMGIALVYIGTSQHHAIGKRHGRCNLQYLLLAFCLSFGAALVVARWRQRRADRRIRLLQDETERYEDFGRDFKMPLLSRGSE